MPSNAPSKRRDLPTLAYFRTNRQMPILYMPGYAVPHTPHDINTFGAYYEFHTLLGISLKVPWARAHRRICFMNARNIL
jgi:hypothetical protein